MFISHNISFVSRTNGAIEILTLAPGACSSTPPPPRVLIPLVGGPLKASVWSGTTNLIYFLLVCDISYPKAV